MFLHSSKDKFNSPNAIFILFKAGKTTCILIILYAVLAHTTHFKSAFLLSQNRQRLWLTLYRTTDRPQPGWHGAQRSVLSTDISNNVYLNKTATSSAMLTKTETDKYEAADRWRCTPHGDCSAVEFSFIFQIISLFTWNTTPVTSKQPHYSLQQ